MIVIIPHTRQFNIPGADLTFGVVSDNDSERKYFQCPRYVGDNLDIAGSFVRINYRNANGEIDSYLVDDLVVDGDNVKFSWLLSQNVTEYKGQVKFVMCVVGPDLKLKWHTTQGTGNVYDGLEPDSTVVESETLDVVAQIIAMVEAQTTAVEEVGEKWVADVNAEGATQVAAVKAAAEDAEAASVAEIEAKGVNTLASIPEDYTALSDLAQSRAGAIVCEAEGSAVTVSDASDMAIRGMRIFGRSTQDGTPTPDAPVEIVSVENPVVTVTGKNLLENKATSQTLKGVTFSTNEDGSFTAKGTSTGDVYFGVNYEVKGLVPGVQYCLNGCPNGGGANTYRLYAQTVDGATFAGDVGFGAKFTAKAGQWQVLFAVYRDVTVDLTVYPMLRLASVENATFEPYDGGSLSLSTPGSLPGIPVTSGGNYTDSNGQEWVCDEVDLERGVYVQRCFSETLEFRYDDPNSRYTASLTHPANSSYGIDNGIPVLCETLPFNAAATKGVNGVRVATTSPTYAIAYYEGVAIESAKLLYPLATPIETPLSDTEIAAYRALHTNYPNTTVLNDAGAHMVVKYVADTKRYIDNKIAALVGGA